MNISSISPVVATAVAQTSAPQVREQAAERQKLIQAVKALNASNALGENNELTFVLDRSTHRTLTRVIDRQTQEVVMQIPAEYVLRLAEQLSPNSSSH